MQALILIDIQKDFLPGGALAVPEGNAVVPVANEYMLRSKLVVATQDWHPANHLSFASQHSSRQVGETIELAGLQQILWPNHCMQNSVGADFADELNQEGIQHIVRKGTDRSVDSYSAFFDNARRHSTGLDDFLRSRAVSEVCMLGLATDYCVKYSALDAIDLGYQVSLVRSGIRGVELEAGDCGRALREMQHAGVTLI